MWRWDVLAGAALCCLVPGCLFVETILYSQRGRLTPFIRLLLGIGISIVYTIAAGLALALVGRLTRLSALAALLIPTAVLLSALLARVLRRGRAGWRRPRPTWAQWGAALCLLLALVAVVGPRLYLMAEADTLPLKPDSWFYMADSLRFAEGGRIPTEITQWGLRTAFPPDKITFQMFTAMLMLTGQAGWEAAFALVTLICLVVAVLAIWRFAAGFVSPPVASLLTILLFLDSKIGAGLYAQRSGLTFYRAESFAVMLGFLALCLTGYALRRRVWWLLAFAPAALAMAATGHGITAAVMALMVGAFFLAGWIVRRKVDRREFVALAGIAAGALAGTVLLFAIGGNVPLYGKSVVDTGAFQSYGREDPTYALRTLLDGESDPQYALTRPKSEGRFYVSPAQLWRDLVEAAFPPAARKAGDLLWPLLFLLLLALSLARPGVSREQRQAGVAFLLAGAFAYLLGLAFSFLYETYSPAMHPSRRVFPYFSLTVLVWGALIVQSAMDGVAAMYGESRRWRALAPAAVFGLTAAALLWTLAWPGAQSFAAAAERSNFGEDGLAALRWIRENTPADALLLTDSRTAGAVEMVAGRMSLTEGRGSYTRPDLLGHELEAIQQARAFYENPFDAGMLARYGVDYVLIAPMNQIGGSQDFTTDVRTVVGLCDAAPALARVAAFGTTTIYRVSDAPAGASVLVFRNPASSSAAARAQTQAGIVKAGALWVAPFAADVLGAPFMEQLRAQGVDVLAIDAARYPNLKRSVERLPLTYLKLAQTQTHAVYVFGAPDGSPAGRVAQGQLALARGDLDGACGHFQAALSQDAGAPLALAGVGLCREAAGEAEAARAAYAQAQAGLNDAGWTLALPARWISPRYPLSEAWADTLKGQALAFVETRLAALDGQIVSDAPAQAVWISQPAGVQGQGGSWRTEVVWGWPQAAFFTSAEEPAHFSPGARPGQFFCARLVAGGTGRAPFEISLSAETASEPVRLAAATLVGGAEAILQGTLPADASGRLTLEPAGSGQNSLIWYNVRGACPTPDPLTAE